MMRNRSQILDEVLELYEQQEELQKDINRLCIEAESIVDEEDDKAGHFSTIGSIRSYRRT